MDSKNYYLNQIETLAKSITQLKSKKKYIATFRFGSVISVLAVLYFLWQVNIFIALGIALVLVILFVQLILKDIKNNAAIKQQEILIEINKAELAALNGAFNQFYDGAVFADKNHLYSNDMDVFGKASLFQFLNRTTSQIGENLLAAWLSGPTPTEIILQRQLAVKELTDKNNFRQIIQAIGTDTKITLSNKTKIENWLVEKLRFIQMKHWQWLRYVVPIIVIIICTLFTFDYVGSNLFYATLFLSSVVAFQINKIVTPLHNQLSGLVNELAVLSQSLEIIENEKFESSHLQNLQNNFIVEQENASSKILQLKKILDRLDLRYNIVIAFPLNVLLQWNLQQILALEKWKSDNKNLITTWYNTLAEIETLNSFATISFNNPTWCFPTINENYFSINAKALGHPLITKTTCVTNPIELDKTKTLMLITGSNMAGKSTYLRAVGVNAILCLAGAPVFAHSFNCSNVQLLSSMRVADNLEENTSTFYAELKKLKTIIEKVNNNEKILVLLDEILRGTNSLDRHTGTEALIKQLVKQKTPALLATHDVSLAELENTFPENLVNYHFDAAIDGTELHFDYKLKQGICKNLNASILMKKIGLDL
jgi:hypothetical protein